LYAKLEIALSEPLHKYSLPFVKKREMKKQFKRKEGDEVQDIDMLSKSRDESLTPDSSGEAISKEIGDIAYSLADDVEIDKVEIEKKLTVGSKPNRGRKKENWEIYLSQANFRIRKNEKDLEEARLKGDSAECSRLRNMISA